MIKCFADRPTDLHGLVELIGRREDVDAGSRHPEGGNVLGHPSEVAAEAVGALRARRRPGDAVRRRVGLGQQGSEQKHRGAAGNQEETRHREDEQSKTRTGFITESVITEKIHHKLMFSGFLCVSLGQ